MTNHLILNNETFNILKNPNFSKPSFNLFAQTLNSQHSQTKYTQIMVIGLKRGME